MRLSRTVTRILLTLSAINFALAAPVTLGRIHERVDMADVSEDETVTSQKLWDLSDSYHWLEQGPHNARSPGDSGDPGTSNEPSLPSPDPTPEMHPLNSQSRQDLINSLFLIPPSRPWLGNAPLPAPAALPADNNIPSSSLDWTTHPLDSQSRQSFIESLFSSPRLNAGPSNAAPPPASAVLPADKDSPSSSLDWTTHPLNSQLRQSFIESLFSSPRPSAGPSNAPPPASATLPADKDSPSSSLDWTTHPLNSQLRQSFIESLFSSPRPSAGPSNAPPPASAALPADKDSPSSSLDWSTHPLNSQLRQSFIESLFSSPRPSAGPSNAPPPASAALPADKDSPSSSSDWRMQPLNSQWRQSFIESLFSSPRPSPRPSNAPPPASAALPTNKDFPSSSSDWTTHPLNSQLRQSLIESLFSSPRPSPRPSNAPPPASATLPADKDLPSSSSDWTTHPLDSQLRQSFIESHLLGPHPSPGPSNAPPPAPAALPTDYNIPSSSSDGTSDSLSSQSPQRKYKSLDSLFSSPLSSHSPGGPGNTPPPAPAVLPADNESPSSSSDETDSLGSQPPPRKKYKSLASLFSSPPPSYRPERPGNAPLPAPAALPPDTHSDSLSSTTDDPTWDPKWVGSSDQVSESSSGDSTWAGSSYRTLAGPSDRVLGSSSGQGPSDRTLAIPLDQTLGGSSSMSESYSPSSSGERWEPPGFRTDPSGPSTGSSHPPSSPSSSTSSTGSPPSAEPEHEVHFAELFKGKFRRRISGSGIANPEEVARYR